MTQFKDAEHLLRLVLVFLAGAVLFIVVRAILVPRSFGQYGHYRGNAIAEIAAKQPVFAGHQTCESCHTDVLDVKSRGKHAGVNCEACHGALASHADDPTSVQPPKLDTLVLCVRCHAASSAKPKSFPQIDAAHGAGLACETCHQPHNPQITAEGKQ